MNTNSFLWNYHCRLFYQCPALREIKLSLLRISVQTAPLKEEGRAKRREFQNHMPRISTPTRLRRTPSCSRGRIIHKTTVPTHQRPNCPSLRRGASNSVAEGVRLCSLIASLWFQNIKGQKGQKGPKGRKGCKGAKMLFTCSDGHCLTATPGFAMQTKQAQLLQVPLSPFRQL